MPITRARLLPFVVLGSLILGVTTSLVPPASAQEVTVRQAEASEDGQRIIIRCGTRLDGASAPLFVVDGVVAPVPGGLRHIMPEDIVSIDVFRGETATERFGSAAAHGVVVITTRHGGGLAEEVAKSGPVAVVYPNPASHRATLSFSLPERSEVSVALFDVSGRRVLKVEPRIVEAGSQHEVVLETSGLASGTYLYRLEVGGDVSSGRLTVAR